MRETRQDIRDAFQAMTKQCSYCSQWKPLSEFYRDSSKRDGLGPRCKDCQRAVRGQKKKIPQSDFLPAEKKCPRCKKIKQAIEFNLKSTGTDGLQSWCISCQVGSRSPRETKSLWLQYKYGMSLFDYERLLEKQNNVCAICGQGETRPNKALAVDHCHETGKVRGLLCQRCNTMLGGSKDNTEILAKAIEYLK